MHNLLQDFNAPKIELPKNSNLVNCSRLFEFYSNKPYRSFSIKYVCSGNEIYAVNGRKYNLSSSQFLIANSFSEGYVLIDSKEQVNGICIDIEPKIISAAVSSYLRPDAFKVDEGLDTFFNTAQFYESVFNADKTSLGCFIKQNSNLIERSAIEGKNFTNEFYYSLSEKLIEDYIPVYKQFQNIRAIKLQTKKELMFKLNKAKSVLEQNFLTNHSIGTIAKEVGISEYHFYRLFKMVFKFSPLQYILHLRLNFAKTELSAKRGDVAEIAFLSGFSDVAAFSKSFKKHFKITPSSLIKISRI